MLLRFARCLARAVVPRALWPLVDEELQAELVELTDRGWPRWRVGSWAAAQYLAVAGRLGAERIMALAADHDRTGFVMLEGWRLDLKQAARSLRTRPTATTTVVVTVALAVGATTAIYSVVDGVLLKPLPYAESEQLARIWMTTAEWRTSPEAEFRSNENRLGPLAPSYFDWLEVETGFESLRAYVDAAYVLQDGDGARALRGQEATAGLFEALRVEPILGRGLQRGDNVVDAPAVVVISEPFWRDQFGASPDALDADLILGGIPHRVVGVMPLGFRAPTSVLMGFDAPSG